MIGETMKMKVNRGYAHCWVKDKPPIHVSKRSAASESLRTYYNKVPTAFLDGRQRRHKN